MPEEVLKVLKTTPLGQRITLENKMSAREKQRAQRKDQRQREEDF